MFNGRMNHTQVKEWLLGDVLKIGSVNESSFHSTEVNTGMSGGPVMPARHSHPLFQALTVCTRAKTTP